jgi:hypothetical protein
MAQRPSLRVPERTVVVVLDVPAMQLEEEVPIGIDEPFVVRAAVIAAGAEEMLEPRARGLDIIDRDERL